MTVPTPATTPSAKPFFVRYRTRVGLLFFIVLLPCLLFVRPHWADPRWVDASWLPMFILRTVGYVCLLAGVLGRLWCTLYIGGRKQCVLQTTGPYSLVRHPLYVGSLLMGLGMVALSQNIVVLVLGAVYFIAQYRVTIRFEEATLAEIFGEQHAEYLRRVPCFIPRLSNFDPTSPGVVNMQPLQLEIARSIAFLSVVPFLDLINQLHAQGILPVFLNFP